MSPLDARLPCGCTEERHLAGLPCLGRPAHDLTRGPDSGGPYRSLPDGPDRIDARRLLNTDPTARAFHDMVTHIYLSGSLTVAEMRVLLTMGMERGMSLETTQRSRA